MSVLIDIVDYLVASFLSATFWTAVGAIGTVAALLLIHRQVQHARYAAAYEFLRREDDRFRADEMRKYRSELAKVLLLQPANFPEIDVSADHLLDYFEDLGLIVKQRLAPPYFVWSMNCYYVVRYWYALLPYINWARTEWHDDTYYSEFEYLYRRVSTTERRESRKRVIACTPSEVRDFLKEELQVTIRHFRPSDLRMVLGIETSAFTTDCYPESQFKDLHNEHPEGFFVAQLLDEVAGYAIAYPSDGKAEIDSIAVDPRYRHLGIGKALATHCVRQFKRQGVAKCSLEVRTSNVSAISFYEHLGFGIIRTAQDYYEEKGDAYVMEMDI